jgi:dTDP-4-amino-4,6-dideoxygalactose transaminase
MIKLLRCPKISIDKIGNYLKNSNKTQQYSNFGYCEKLLREKFSNILSVPFDSICLGSSATALLKISCEAIFEKIGSKNSSAFFPVFSFFSTFSIASSLQQNVHWVDINKKSFLPEIKKKITKDDLLYMNVPFGVSSKLDDFFDYAKKLPCFVVIDAAACLPGIIYNKKKLNHIPSNVIVVFSLHATKLISCGEGGMCVFGEDIPKHIMQLTNFGIYKTRTQKWEKSFNAKMSEFNAAAGLSSLDDFDKNSSQIMEAKRKAKNLSKKYNIQMFKDIDEPTLAINIEINNTSNVMKKLLSKNYETRQWWSLSKNIKDEEHKNSICMYESLMGIPFDWEHIDQYYDNLCQEISSIKVS